MRSTFIFYHLILWVALTGPVFAKPSPLTGHPNPLLASEAMGFTTDWWRHFRTGFKGSFGVLQLLAPVATYAIVQNDIDGKTSKWFNSRPDLTPVFFPVAISGVLAPVFLSGAFWLHGHGHNNSESLGAAYAVAQATFLCTVYITGLKALSGRPNPNPDAKKSLEKQSRVFKFGFLKNGIFWGWPSGHTAATTGALAALMAYYPHRLWLKFLSYTYLVYTIIGVSAVGDGRMHWLSDGVAAFLMSIGIGDAVGQGYRAMMASSPINRAIAGNALRPFCNLVGCGMAVRINY